MKVEMKRGMMTRAVRRSSIQRPYTRELMGVLQYFLRDVHNITTLRHSITIAIT